MPFNDPVMSQFFGAPPMVFVTITDGVFTVCSGLWRTIGQG